MFIHSFILKNVFMSCFYIACNCNALHYLNQKSGLKIPLDSEPYSYNEMKLNKFNL